MPLTACFKFQSALKWTRHRCRSFPTGLFYSVMGFSAGFYFSSTVCLWFWDDRSDRHLQLGVQNHMVTLSEDRPSLLLVSHLWVWSVLSSHICIYQSMSLLTQTVVSKWSRWLEKPRVLPKVNSVDNPAIFYNKQHFLSTWREQWGVFAWMSV